MKAYTIIIILLLGFGFTSAQKKAPYPSPQWSKSTALKQGIDGSALTTVISDIKKGQTSAKIDSLLIVRNGYLILEEYFNEFNSDKIHTQQSVSKSFTSALIGIAIDKGIIKNVNQKILSFFPEIKNIENLDEHKKIITLKDLLTMRSGTDYNENGPNSPHYQLNALSKGWDTFYLNRPMARKPGFGWQYDSGGVILMSAILRNLTGKHADIYMEEELFPTLGIKKKWWFKNAEGHPHTGGGLNIRPLDMAKFGLLYLREGKWKDKQLISEKWVKESFTMHHNFNNRTGSNDRGYGYLWWILKPVPKSKSGEFIYAAKGYMGQYIILIPEYDMIVVFTGSSRNGYGMRKPFDILYQKILPSVKQ